MAKGIKVVFMACGMYLAVFAFFFVTLKSFEWTWNVVEGALRSRGYLKAKDPPALEKKRQ